MDIWLKTKFVGFIRNLIKKEQEEKNYIESQDLFGEEISKKNNNEILKRKKSFTCKLFDNNKTLSRKKSFKYSSSAELLKDIKIIKNNYFRRNSETKLPTLPILPIIPITPSKVFIQTFEQEKNNVLFKVIGYLLTLLKHYVEIYIPNHKAKVVNSITQHKTYE